jgi:hypothetical protein
MNRSRILGLVAVVACLALASGLAGMAQAGEGLALGHVAYQRAAVTPWHGSFYDPAWGMPIALVVPPNAENQTHWGWGVGNTRMTTIDHQFRHGYPGPGVYNRRGFQPTPPWPSSTDQFGVYYVRGPW